jgi:NarL family two-component system response regulator LiaR
VAIEQLNKAIVIVDEIQHGSLRWKIRLSLADTLLKAGKPFFLAVHQARELADQLARSLSGSDLEEKFLASHWVRGLKDLERIPMPVKVSYPAGLTEREVEVLRLVASGATNQQIAVVLHISVRTVNTHITNILNKIGCENRTAASAFALQNKLLST